MGNKTRVVVTGLGAITPIGNDVASFWQGLKDKKVGIAPITYFDTTDYKAKLAGEVKDFDPKKYMDPKAARRMEPFSQYAVAAAGEAIAQAGLDMEKEDPFRVGTSIGSGIGSLQAMEREHKKNAGKRTEPREPAARSDDDQQHGSRQCGNALWFKGQIHQRGNCLCDRYELYR